MAKPKRILVVEDDVPLNNGIVLSFKHDNYDMIQAFSVSEAKKQLNLGSTIDLILLDINLPDGNGLDLCRQIRRTCQIPIIFLTANDMEIDIISGFEMGGDDYITKPFSLAVLRARVAAILRRNEHKRETDSRNCYAIDNFVFDFEGMVFTKNDKGLSLSKTEQRLLRFLVQNIGHTLTRDTLLDVIWGDGTEFVDENALSVTIRRLRSKIEDNPSSPKYIHTVYGIGYTWTVKSDE